MERLVIFVGIMMMKLFLMEHIEIRKYLYQKHDQNYRDVSNNYRKGKTKKTISTDNGKIDIQVPREQLSTFEPKIVKKHERNISRIEDQILFLYSK